MATVNRKNFILLFVTSALGIFLTSCFSKMKLAVSSVSNFVISTAASRETESENTENTEESSTETMERQKSGSSSREPEKQQAMVGIAGSDNGGSLSVQIEKAVALAGGLDFIKWGSTVLIKPNFNTGDPHPASTNPEVIRHVIRLVKDRNPSRILVGDRSSFWTDTISCMKQNGAYEVVREEDAELYPFDNAEWVTVNPANAESWRRGFTIPKILNEVDYIISVPVIKTHSIAVFSMAIKNWVGILSPLQRTADLHLFGGNKETFGYMLAELHLARKPDFIVMDGTRIFVEGGPTEGKAIDAGLIVASNDLVANDIVGLAILKTLGTVARIQDYSAWSQPQIVRAVELGLGVRTIDEIKISSENVEEINYIISNLE